MFSAHIEKQWNNAPYFFARGMENFKIAVARNAQYIFKQSFEEERFYSPGSTPWAPLQPSTVRARKGSRHPILTFTGALKRSIIYSIDGKTELTDTSNETGHWVDEQSIIKSNRQMLAKGVTYRESRWSYPRGRGHSVELRIASRYQANGAVKVFTDPRVFKKLTKSKVCYAAVHNEGGDGGYYYGKSGIPATKRQFMGYSGYADSAMRAYTIQYIVNNLPGL